MEQVKGTAGYQAAVDQFIAATSTIDFAELHKPYLSLIPTEVSRILDVGAGSGRDASILASMGHQVVAVEPLPALLSSARSLNDSHQIRWIKDSLPDLKSLDSDDDRFDFVLVSAVWHHLDESERNTAMTRLAALVASGGIFALTLRNGPAGAGSHSFPTNARQTIAMAADAGFELLVAETDLPSLVSGKAGVRWAKLAFRRCLQCQRKAQK